jgi:Tetratricopeptide repeat
MRAEEIRSLLDRLEATPDDADLRRRAAEALDAAGQRDEAQSILAPLVNLTGHDDDVGLPCLCKACLPRAGAAAEASGMTFKRSFAVVGKRVLHFWQLAEQEPERLSVRRSVEAALKTRLAASKARQA